MSRFQTYCVPERDMRSLSSSLHSSPTTRTRLDAVISRPGGGDRSRTAALVAQVVEQRVDLEQLVEKLAQRPDVFGLAGEGTPPSAARSAKRSLT